MKRFLDEIKKGNFVISKCEKCNLIIWPPSELCNQCFSQVKWEKISEFGTVLEYSKKENDFFGIVEFEKKIRIIGIFLNNFEPKIGGKIRIKDCSTIDENPSFSFEQIKNDID